MKIENRIGVRAPAEVIWDIVYDLAAWPQWNPIYPQAGGEIRIGATLDLTLALPGQPHRRLRPVVLDWVPREQILWRTSEAMGLVRAVRYIEIESLDVASCIVANGELFEGLLTAQVVRGRHRSLRAGFQAMGEALKDRAEAAWRAGAAAPTSEP